MPLPGITPLAGGLPVVNLSLDADATMIELYGLAGSPTYPIDLYVIVQVGVTIRSNSVGTPAMRAEWPSANGSRIFLRNLGRIQGRGGDGGDGSAITGFIGLGGGGGGGAGTVSGRGGDGGSPGANDGANGTDTAGGAGGLNINITASSDHTRTDGDDGGDALKTNIPMIVDNGSGQIWSGGGGGNGGTPGEDGSAGGGPGVDGESSLSGPGGIAGNSVTLVGAGTVSFLSGGSSPNLEGPIG